MWVYVYDRLIFCRNRVECRPVSSGYCSATVGGGCAGAALLGRIMRRAHQVVTVFRCLSRRHRSVETRVVSTPTIGDDWWLFTASNRRKCHTSNWACLSRSVTSSTSSSLDLHHHHQQQQWSLSRSSRPLRHEAVTSLLPSQSLIYDIHHRCKKHLLFLSRF